MSKEEFGGAGIAAAARRQVIKWIFGFIAAGAVVMALIIGLFYGIGKLLSALISVLF